MCKLRGWTLESRRPEQYARLTTDDVDEYLQKKAGLEIGERDNPDRLIKCVRYKEINPANPHIVLNAASRCPGLLEIYQK